MTKVEFYYNGFINEIFCKEDEKMRDIINRFLTKIDNNNPSLFYLYNGTKIDLDLTIKEQANDIDIKRKKMNIIVNAYKRDEDKKGLNEMMISKDIICPECRENIFIDINNYKINLFGCKYEHTQNNILLNLFEESQKINLNEIICDICKKNNKKNTHNNEFFICNSCKKKMCPLCKSFHDKNHRIIKYEDKNYICESHNNEAFTKYCENCNKNICIICEKNHTEHKLYDLSKIIIIKDDLLKTMENLKNVIDKFKYKINAIKDILNNMTSILDLYHKINNEFVQNYNVNKRNYYKLKNLNYLKQNNEALIN